MELLLSLILPITTLLFWAIGLSGILKPNLARQWNVWFHQKRLDHMQARPYTYSQASMDQARASIERLKNPSRFAQVFGMLVSIVALSIAMFLTVLFVIAWVNVD